METSRCNAPSSLHHHAFAGEENVTHATKGGRRKEEQTLILERVSAPRVMLLLDNQTGQLVNIGQMVKASSQLWSKLQKWLNKRGRIGNWTEIKLLIN